MAKSGEQRAADTSLGAHLARLRAASGMSLRQVEEATNNEVSNAYLSQLENNRITRPSPNILHALARVYNSPYEDLMKRAGYLSSEQAAATAATFAVQGLTPDEEKALLEYLAFIRKQKQK